VAVWLVVSAILTTLALRNLSTPGLYYDEAVNGGMAKDFVTGNVHATHMPDAESVTLFGRPFPLFVQWYFGALKPWLIIPSLVLFDSTVPVLRLTSLCWYLVGLLIFMLWTRRLLGLSAALVAAPILGLDPSFFLPSVVDWGPIVPGFLCRMGGYYFLIRWWQDGKLRDGFLGALALGLGFFCKIDFVVILLGCGIALAVTWRKEMLAFVRSSPGKWAFCCLGFLLGASPMLLRVSRMLDMAMGKEPPGAGNSLLEKLNTAWTMYDGSYFLRLMEVGGRFDVMFAPPCRVWGPFGLAVVLSGVLLAAGLVRRAGDAAERRRRAFLLLSLALLTGGVFLLPGTVRIHHHVMVYPFPHLIVVAAILTLWGKSSPQAAVNWKLRTCAVVVAAVVIGGHLVATLRTQSFLAATGGRGLWSDSIMTFCNDLRAQDGLGVTSLDWGFNEQIGFLCNNRQLSEPFWLGKPKLVPASTRLYLVPPLDYSTFGGGWDFYISVRDAHRSKMSIEQYRDREGQLAFSALRVYGFAEGRKCDEEIEAAIARLRAALKSKPYSSQDHFNLGALLEGRGLAAEAIAHYRRAAKIRPDDAEVRYNLGMALYRPGTMGEAVSELRETVRAAPHNVVFVNRLAWVLATCPEARLRNGGEAIRLAQWLVHSPLGPYPLFLATLAAAHGEAGDFARAVEAGERAAALASARGQRALADAVGLQIDRYRAGSPYHETPAGSRN
jgi:hypothetical protein